MKRFCSSVPSLLLFGAIQCVASTTWAIEAPVDPTGLVGKTLTGKPVPKDTDVTMTLVGNGYYLCGGSTIAGDSSGLHLTTLRKGVNPGCGNSRVVLALTKKADNQGTEFLDAVELTVPKGYGLIFSGCKGAQVALSKIEDKQFLTKHAGAWTIVNNKLSPVTDTRAVKCQNEGYGV